MSESEVAWLEADWPVPGRVRALTTLRTGGVSGGPFASLNLGARVGDDPGAVATNRQRLAAAAGLPAEPVWLKQVHGVRVVQADPPNVREADADAAVTDQPGVVCAVLTADCLPVFLARMDGSAVAVAHAGWRGLAAGVIESTIAALDPAHGPLAAWLGPAIGPDAFEVGPEVREAFVDCHADDASAFHPGHGDRYLADLYALARARLSRAGVTTVSGGGHCTYAEEAAFFSHRRDGLSGRMASLIWME